MASMLLVGGFMPKPTLVRMPNTRLSYQRKTLIIRAKRGHEVSHGGGGKINQAQQSSNAANDAEEKVTVGGFNTEEENKKKSKGDVDNGGTMNSEASG